MVEEQKQPAENKEKEATVTPDSSVTSEETQASAKKAFKKSKKNKKFVTKGKVFVQATYNNTIVTMADWNGNSLAWASAGLLGFKGAKKATPFAAGEIVRTVSEKVKDMGLKDVDVYVKGIGSGREAAVRALNANGFNILAIHDTTPVPHNGCRPKKPRRV